MRAKVISFSKRGYELSVLIQQALFFHETELVYRGRDGLAGFQPESKFEPQSELQPESRPKSQSELRRTSLQKICKKAFEEQTALIFICAAGIAVRSIAPFIGDKLTDPPVLVVDECALHVIPILSGHVGGANALAREIAGKLGSDPVITTASELSEIRNKSSDQRRYCIGIGTRRGKSLEEIEKAVLLCMEMIGVRTEEIELIATIDKKRNEPGLLAFAEKYFFTLMTYSAEALSGVDGIFAGSNFVKDHVGVDNVCERASIAGLGGKGRLVCHKYASDGVTVAIAEREV